MTQLRAIKVRKSFKEGVGEISYLGHKSLDKPFTVIYFLSFESREIERNTGSDWDGINTMSFALRRLFGRENLVFTSEGVLIFEDMGEHVHNPHGLIRNRLCRIEKAFEEIRTGRRRLTRTELGLDKYGRAV